MQTIFICNFIFPVARVLHLSGDPGIPEIITAFSLKGLIRHFFWNTSGGIGFCLLKRFLFGLGFWMITSKQRFCVFHILQHAKEVSDLNNFRREKHLLTLGSLHMCVCHTKNERDLCIPFPRSLAFCLWFPFQISQTRWCCPMALISPVFYCTYSFVLYFIPTKFHLSINPSLGYM